jgi:hypothetical protein
LKTDLALHEVAQQGFTVVPNVLDTEFKRQLRLAMDQAHVTCRDIQIKGGLSANTDGAVHHILSLDPVFLKLLAMPSLQEFLNAFFDSPCILNSYSGVLNLPNSPTYVSNVHRDVRTFSRTPEMLNLLVMLDDFTEENGATWILPGSHLNPEKPSNEEFFGSAKRALGKAGDFLIFDSNSWHAAGINQTDHVRRALTVTFTRPYMKQQFDYPRSLGWEKCATLDKNLQQLVGYRSRVPATLEEWYQPIDHRFYQADQG